MKLQDVDLNILLAFDTLMKERSVTKAAQRLFVSQSAMSHTLRRLREVLDDPVLVSTPGGMLPTPRALELVDPVSKALGLIEKSISPATRFDPKTSDKRFLLGSTDYVEYVVLPPLMKHLETAAPHVSIQLKRFSLNTTEDYLEKGSLHAVIQFQHTANPRLRHLKLLEEIPVVLARVDHPEIGDSITREQYIELPHIVIDSFEDSPIIQQIWKKHNLYRKVALRSPNFLSAPIILASSDMIATLPLKLAERFIKGGRLKIIDFPLPIKTFNLELVWHKLLDKDPAQKWFIEQLQTVVSPFA